MKLTLKNTLTISAILFCCSFNSLTFNNDSTQSILGIWKWMKVINSETKEEAGIEMITMGMAKEVKTEFLKDGSYLEHKWREGKSEPSTIKGEWKLEADGKMLSMKPKENWMETPVILLTEDSLIIQMHPTMQLLMIKEK